MTDRELVEALTREYGDVQFCGRTGDLEIATAFVAFVQALPDTRIHPNDILENTLEGSAPKDVMWSAQALEYVFSDHSPRAHADVVVEFFATLTASQRAHAWRAAYAECELAGADAGTLLDALAERIALS